MSKNREVFHNLLGILDKLTNFGTEFNMIDIVSTGTRISFHSTVRGRSLNILGSDNMAFMFQAGAWILTSMDSRILYQQVMYLKEDSLYFMDLKTPGWIQVFLPEKSYMVNLKLFSYSGIRKFIRRLVDKEYRLKCKELSKYRR